MVTKPTFIPEDIPEATYFIHSSLSLRKEHVTRRFNSFLAEIISQERDPFKAFTKEEYSKFREGWKKEAELKYPMVGDYLVWLKDENGNDIPIGEKIEFIGSMKDENLT